MVTGRVLLLLLAAAAEYGTARVVCEGETGGWYTSRDTFASTPPKQTLHSKCSLSIRSERPLKSGEHTWVTFNDFAQRKGVVRVFAPANGTEPMWVMGKDTPESVKLATPHDTVRVEVVPDDDNLVAVFFTLDVVLHDPQGVVCPGVVTESKKAYEWLGYGEDTGKDCEVVLRPKKESPEQNLRVSIGQGPVLVYAPAGMPQPKYTWNITAGGVVETHEESVVVRFQSLGSGTRRTGRSVSVDTVYPTVPNCVDNPDAVLTDLRGRFSAMPRAVAQNVDCSMVVHPNRTEDYLVLDVRVPEGGTVFVYAPHSNPVPSWTVKRFGTIWTKEESMRVRFVTAAGNSESFTTEYYTSSIADTVCSSAPGSVLTGSKGSLMSHLMLEEDGKTLNCSLVIRPAVLTGDIVLDIPSWRFLRPEQHVALYAPAESNLPAVVFSAYSKITSLRFAEKSVRVVSFSDSPSPTDWFFGMAYRVDSHFSPTPSCSSNDRILTTTPSGVVPVSRTGYCNVVVAPPVPSGWTTLLRLSHAAQSGAVEVFAPAGSVTPRLTFFDGKTPVNTDLLINDSSVRVQFYIKSPREGFEMTYNVQERRGDDGVTWCSDHPGAVLTGESGEIGEVAAVRQGRGDCHLVIRPDNRNGRAIVLRVRSQGLGMVHLFAPHDNKTMLYELEDDDDGEYQEVWIREDSVRVHVPGHQGFRASYFLAHPPSASALTVCSEGNAERVLQDPHGNLSSTLGVHPPNMVCSLVIQPRDGLPPGGYLVLRFTHFPFRTWNDFRVNVYSPPDSLFPKWSINTKYGLTGEQEIWSESPSLRVEAVGDSSVTALRYEADYRVEPSRRIPSMVLCSEANTPLPINGSGVVGFSIGLHPAHGPCSMTLVHNTSSGGYLVLRFLADYSDELSSFSIATSSRSWEAPFRKGEEVWIADSEVTLELTPEGDGSFPGFQIAYETAREAPVDMVVCSERPGAVLNGSTGEIASALGVESASMDCTLTIRPASKLATEYLVLTFTYLSVEERKVEVLVREDGEVWGWDLVRVESQPPLEIWSLGEELEVRFRSKGQGGYRAEYRLEAPPADDVYQCEINPLATRSSGVLMQRKGLHRFFSDCDMVVKPDTWEEGYVIRVVFEKGWAERELAIFAPANTTRDPVLYTTGDITGLTFSTEERSLVVRFFGLYSEAGYRARYTVGPRTPTPTSTPALPSPAPTARTPSPPPSTTSPPSTMSPPTSTGLPSAAPSTSPEPDDTPDLVAGVIVASVIATGMAVAAAVFLTCGTIVTPTQDPVANSV